MSFKTLKKSSKWPIKVATTPKNHCFLPLENCNHGDEPHSWNSCTLAGGIYAAFVLPSL